MHKLVKLGIVSMSALVLVACGESDTVDKDNLPLDAVTLQGNTEDYTESGEVDTENLPVDLGEVEGYDEEDSENEEEQFTSDVEVPPLTVGESTTIEDITFTVTDSKYIDASSNSDEGVSKVLQVSYAVENNSDNAYGFGNDVSAFIDDSWTYTNYYNESTSGTLLSGESIDGNLYFDVVGEPEELPFDWSPNNSYSEDGTPLTGSWNVLPN